MIKKQFPLNNFVKFPKISYEPYSSFLLGILNEGAANLTQPINYLSKFPPDRANQVPAALPTEELKGILYHGMPTAWQTKMTEQGYSYLEDAITLQNMADFFETRCENLEESTSKSQERVKKEK